jgi:hypothetical protein
MYYTNNVSTKPASMDINSGFSTGRWWLTPVILTTQEADIRKIVVKS